MCDACWGAVARWSPPWCACCGQPQSPWRPAADVCPRCRRIAGALPVRVVGPYEGRLRDVLHTFKYDGRRSLAPTLAGLMRAQAADVLAAADVLVPVPLHRARRRARGFNQAHDLAALLGPPVIAALQRVRATTAQTALTASARRRNVRGAFALAPAGYGRGRWSHGGAAARHDRRDRRARGGAGGRRDHHRRDAGGVRGGAAGGGRRRRPCGYGRASRDRTAALTAAATASFGCSPSISVQFAVVAACRR